MYKDNDIVSTSGEIPEKFIRELLYLANIVNIPKTLTLMWYDEYAFLPYNSTIYLNAAPAFKTASMIAKQHGAPFGVLLTTTPGRLLSMTIAVYYSNIVLLTLLNCWYRLKLSSQWRRKSETIREMGKAEIQSLFYIKC